MKVVTSVMAVRLSEKASREDDKPVGLVYIGCCYKGETHVKECDLSGDRHTIRCQSTKEALKFVLDIIKTNR